MMARLHGWTLRFVAWAAKRWPDDVLALALLAQPDQMIVSVQFLEQEPVYRAGGRSEGTDD